MKINAPTDALLKLCHIASPDSGGFPGRCVEARNTILGTETAVWQLAVATNFSLSAGRATGKPMSDNEAVATTDGGCLHGAAQLGLSR